MDNYTFLRSHLIEYKKNILNNAFDQDVKYYNKIKKIMYQMTIHHPLVISQLLDEPGFKLDEKTMIYKILSNEDDVRADEISEIIRIIKRLFNIVKSIDIYKIHELRNCMLLLVDDIILNLSINNDNDFNKMYPNPCSQADDPCGVLMTYIRPKLSYWLHYASLYCDQTHQLYTKIIKYIRKKYNESQMTDNDFVINNYDIFKLLEDYDSNLNEKLNIFIAVTERSKIIKNTFDNEEIINEKTALEFMHRYNQSMIKNINTVSVTQRALRRIPKTYPWMNTIDRNQGIFKNISWFEYQKLQMLNDLTKKMNTVDTNYLLLIGTYPDNVLPDHLDNGMIDKYKKIYGSLLNKNTIINDLQLYMDHEDIFDLTQNFDENQWIRHEIMNLNYIVANN